MLLTEHDFHDLASAYLSRAHSQKVLYAEMFFDMEWCRYRVVMTSPIAQIAR